MIFPQLFSSFNGCANVTKPKFLNRYNFTHLALLPWETNWCNKIKALCLCFSFYNQPFAHTSTFNTDTISETKSLYVLKVAHVRDFVMVWNFCVATRTLAYEHRVRTQVVVLPRNLIIYTKQSKRETQPERSSERQYNKQQKMRVTSSLTKYTSRSMVATYSTWWHLAFKQNRNGMNADEARLDTRCTVNGYSLWS